MDLAGKRVIVTGGSGFLGTKVLATLRGRGVADANMFVPRSADYDLTDQTQTAAMYRAAFGSDKADAVLHLAAEVAHRARRHARTRRNHLRLPQVHAHPL